MESVLFVVLAILVALVVAVPLRRGPEVDRRDDERRAALEAAKEAIYRQIRDAEMDLRMGKLEPEDHRATDRELRAEAIEILRELDVLGAGEGDELGAGEGGDRAEAGR